MSFPKIKLRSGVRGKQPQPSVNNEPSASRSAAKSKRYRDKVKQNPVRYEMYRLQAAERSRAYRASLSSEKKLLSNERTLIRMQEYRERLKKQKLEKAASQSEEPPKPMTRGDEEKIRHKREYWKQQKRSQRVKQSSQKKRRINETRRKRYKKAKLELEKVAARTARPRSKSIPAVVAENHENLEPAGITEQSHTSQDALRKAVQRARSSLPRSPRRIAATVEKVIASCSPNKQVALARINLRFSKENQLQKKLTDVLATEVQKRKTSNERAISRTILKTVTVLKKYKLLRTASSAFGIGWRRLIRHSKERKAAHRHGSALPSDTVHKVQEFYEDHSTPLPFKKAVSKRTGKAKSFLSKTLENLHADFQEENPENSIGFIKFSQLRPPHVRLQKEQTLDQCLCEYCTNANLQLRALNRLCDDKNFQECKIQNIYAAVNLTMCPKQEGEHFYKKACIDKSCKLCSVEAIEKKLAEVTNAHGNDKRQWQQWGTIQVTRSTKKGGTKTSTVKVLQQHEGPVSQLVKELQQGMKFLGQHLHTAKWQHEQFNTLRKDLPEGCVMMVLDFAENYTCQYQDEVQSAHWTHEQATVHPIVSYYRCGECEDRHLVTESLVFISGDKTHDQHAVRHFVTVANHFLTTDRDLSIEKEVQFSDGCARQYKSRHAFYDISQARVKYGFPIERVYFGSRHGKGPSDGESAVIKSKASSAVKARRVVIANAKDMFDFCTLTMTKKPKEDGTCKDFRRTFFWVPDGFIQRNDGPADVGRILGSRKFQSVLTISATEIATRSLTCFCPQCWAGPVSRSKEVCENKSHADQWKKTKLKITPAIETGDNNTSLVPASTTSDSNTALVPASTPGDNNTALGPTSTSSDSNTALVPASTTGDSNTALVLASTTGDRTTALVTGNESRPHSLRVHYDVGDWVAVLYDDQWWPGTIDGKDDEQKIHISFMKSIGPNKFCWPVKAEQDSIPQQEIMCKLDPPYPINSRHFSFNANTVEFARRKVDAILEE